MIGTAEVRESASVVEVQEIGKEEVQERAREVVQKLDMKEVQEHAMRGVQQLDTKGVQELAIEEVQVVGTAAVQLAEIAEEVLLIALAGQVEWVAMTGAHLTALGAVDHPVAVEVEAEAHRHRWDGPGRTCLSLALLPRLHSPGSVRVLLGWWGR